MKTPELIAAIQTYPPDAEWDLFAEFGPHVEWTEACGCVFGWSFYDADVHPKVKKCDATCIQYEDDRGSACLKCGHLCQPFRNPTMEEQAQNDW